MKKDPNSTGSEEDILAQTKLLLEIRDNLESVMDMINQLEWLRKQLYELKPHLKDNKNAESIIASGKELDDKIISTEQNLFQLKVTGKGQDEWYYRDPSKLITKFLNLVGSVSKADFPPTTQHIEHHEELKTKLSKSQSQFDEILEKDLPAFNELLKKNNLPHLIAVKMP